MLRIAFALSLVACAPPDPGDPGYHGGDPDAAACYFGQFNTAAPRPNLHYDKNLSVIIDESELQGVLDIKIVDDAGNIYDHTSESFAPYEGSNSWWSEDTFTYALAANTRYTLTVRNCNDVQTTVFFTSAD